MVYFILFNTIHKRFVRRINLNFRSDKYKLAFMYYFKAGKMTSNLKAQIDNKFRSLILYI